MMLGHIYKGYIITASSQTDYDSKCSKIDSGDTDGFRLAAPSAYQNIMNMLTIATVEERYEIYRYLQNEFEEHRMLHKEHISRLFKQAEEERIKKQREQEYGEVAGHS